MLEVKPYEQKKSGFCGPASLKMVLDFYGMKKSEKVLAQMCKATVRHGMEASGFQKAAKKLGFKILIKDFSDFSDINFYLKKKIPLIVDWFWKDDGHYSVIIGLDKKYVYLADPEIGRIKKIKRDVFKRVWFDFPGSYLKNRNQIIIRRLIAIYK